MAVLTEIYYLVYYCSYANPLKGLFMTTLPLLKDWKGDLERRIQNKNQGEQDILAVIHMCQSTLQDIQPAYQYVQEHRAEIQEWLQEYERLYVRRFRKEPTPLPTDDIPEYLLLDTPEKRKTAIRQAALALAEPGGETSDKDILREIEAEGMRLIAQNPAAAISTIIYGFKSEFDKVEGQMGVFRRKIQEVGETIV